MKSKCVRVHKRECSQVLRILKSAGVVRADLKLKRDNVFVEIPVSSADVSKLSELMPDTRWELCEDEFEEISRGLTYKDLLKSVLPEEVIRELPRSYSIIGDIAVIHLPEELLAYGSKVASAIMNVAKNVKVVYAASGVAGEYRLMNLVHLGGERRSWTIHKEYGIRIYVDVKKAYYNPSLSEEHRRIARKVRDGEVIIDLFAGVGPFALHILTSRRCRVYVVDINPDAILCFLKSIELNRREIVGEFVAVIGDALKLAEVLRDECADRIIMNLPHKAPEYIPEVITKVKVGGILHVYCVARSRNEASKYVLGFAESRGSIREVVKVLDYAPFKYIYRVDLVRTA
ncbi:MAG: class I SAM-dependent methyltransferase family protein [Desulfurococcales archaeon]|nr:class I SAM-dependent methyltransferase family protein [Desulfurococcales archaeon]